MQVKKVFNIDAKTICQKPPYVKPKYKTYRELLDLDRPKKIIQQQSDDQNDDFLQKLMKQQKKKQQEQKQKQKQKKNSGKTKPTSQAHPNNQLTKQLQLHNKNPLKNSSLPSPKQKPNQHNQSVEYLDKKIQTEQVGSNVNTKQKKNTTQNEQLSFSQTNQPSHQYKKQPIKVLIRKRNSSQDNLRQHPNLHSDNRTNSQIGTQEQLFNALVKLSQTESNKIIKNNFITSHKFRKTNGYKQLQRNAHHQKPNAKNMEHLIETKLNPQNKLIEHTISPHKCILQNPISCSQKAKDYLLKSASSMPVEMLLMNKQPAHLNQSKYKTAMIARKSLFKSSYQQELFIKSLKKQ